MTNRDPNAAQTALLEAIQQVLADHGGSGAGGKAPAYAHKQLDAMLSAKAAVAGDDGISALGAPGWAHALLDFLWDLF